MNAEKIIIHPQTQKQLQQFVRTPHHALLLVGADGMGKATVARYISAQLLKLQPGQLGSYPYLLSVIPEGGGSIPIDTVRGIQKFLQLKTTGSAPIRRAVIVEHAEDMAHEAQNALLKLLEEPPADTVLILTVQSKRLLLPTILSRSQAITVRAPEQESLQHYFAESGKSNELINRAYFLSGGLPGLMSSLLNNQDGHPLLAQVTLAKQLLQKTAFEKLSLADGIAKQKPELEKLLEALRRIAASGLKQAGEKQDAKAVRQWYHIQKEVFHAQDALGSSANSKLLLTKLLLHI